MAFRDYGRDNDGGRLRAQISLSIIGQKGVGKRTLVQRLLDWPARNNSGVEHLLTTTPANYTLCTEHRDYYTIEYTPVNIQAVALPATMRTGIGPQGAVQGGARDVPPPLPTVSLPPVTENTILVVFAYNVMQRSSFELLQIAKIKICNYERVILLAIHSGESDADWAVSRWEGFDYASRYGFIYQEVYLSESGGRQSAASVSSLLDTVVKEYEDAEVARYSRNHNIFKLAARSEEERKRKRAAGKIEQFYKRLFSLLFDLFQVVLACMDVVTDLWVAVNFWQEGQKTYAKIAIADLALAQVSYTILFMVLYYRNPTFKGFVVRFLFILPFGQLIPLVIYIISFRFKAIDACMTLFNFSHQTTYRDDNEDPLQEYLHNKLRSHMGFYIEAVVEAIPQSILQMVAITSTGQVSAVNVISLTLSISSVATKGLMASYSINRPAFVMNFMCIIFDVFSVFCITSWLFFAPAVPVETPSFALLTRVWWIKEIVFTSAVALLGLLIYAGFVANLLTDWLRRIYYHRQPCKETLLYVLLAVSALVGGVAVFGPVMLVLEGMKLAFVPLLIFKSIDSPHGRQVWYYDRLFKFLRTDDFREKVYCVNKVLTNALGHRFPANFARPDKNELNYYNIDHLHDRMVAYIEDVAPEDFSLSTWADTSGYSFEYGYKAVANAIRNARGVEQDHSATDTIVRIGMFYVVLILGPIWAVSALYSFFFPFLHYFLLPNNVAAPLQNALTVVLMVVVGIILLLARPAVQFRKSVYYTMMYGERHLNMYWLDRMDQLWRTLQTRKQCLQQSNSNQMVDTPVIELVKSPMTVGIRVGTGPHEFIPLEESLVGMQPTQRRNPTVESLPSGTSDVVAGPSSAPSKRPALTVDTGTSYGSAAGLLQGPVEDDIDDGAQWASFGLGPVLAELAATVPQLSHVLTPRSASARSPRTPGGTAVRTPGSAGSGGGGGGVGGVGGGESVFSFSPRAAAQAARAGGEGDDGFEQPLDVDSFGVDPSPLISDR